MRVLILTVLCVLAASPAGAQEQRVGQVAKSSVGTAGQRQDRHQSVADISPIARLETRLPNRVQSRIRNRIDRFYDPEANAISPFKVATDQSRVGIASRLSR